MNLCNPCFLTVRIYIIPSTWGTGTCFYPREHGKDKAFCRCSVLRELTLNYSKEGHTGWAWPNQVSLLKCLEQWLSPSPQVSFLVTHVSVDGATWQGRELPRSWEQLLAQILALPLEPALSLNLSYFLQQITLEHAFLVLIAEFCTRWNIQPRRPIFNLCSHAVS